VVDKDSEEWRAQCEARHWLAQIGSSKGKFDALILTIKKVRGQSSSDKLAANIRKEWKAKRQPRSLQSEKKR
jgi:hypothetical protein